MVISVIQDAGCEVRRFYLADGEIHVWLANLTLPEDRLATLAATLTVDEQERATRFRFPEHRDRFIAARGGLRELLGAYLGDPAAALRFRQGARGKPALAGEATGLHFNLSHSGDRVLYAVARREVGVDLEAMDRRVDEAAVAERVCTVREWTAFQALPAERQRDAFFACWTRKEAVAKAIGEGLASGLNTLDDVFSGRCSVGWSGESARCRWPGMECAEFAHGVRLGRSTGGSGDGLAMDSTRLF